MISIDRISDKKTPDEKKNDDDRNDYFFVHKLEKNDFLDILSLSSLKSKLCTITFNISLLDSFSSFAISSIS